MARYFNYFPKTFYSLQDSVRGLDTVTNITARFSLEQSFLDNTTIYLKYDVQESDTPEIVADKIYGSPERHWIVLAANQIVDPQWEWPLEYRTLITYITDKYTANAVSPQTGLEWAQSNIYAYYQVETRTTILTQTSVEKKIQIDANTYANVVPSTVTKTLSDGAQITIETSKETKTYYDYELEENENKRAIRLIKPEFAFSLEEELKRVFS
jgi:hypothetical protein